MNHALERELIEQVDRLPEAKQVRVLEFARQLVERAAPSGEPAGNLLQFAGLFPPDVCDEMERAIEEGCESINPDEW